MWCGGEESLDLFSLVVPAADEGIRTLRRRKRGCVQGLLREEGGIAFVEKGVQLGPERRRTVDAVELHFRGGKGDQGRIGAVMVRTKGAKGVGESGRNVVDLLVELFEYYGISIPGRENAFLMAYRRGAGWSVWTRGEAAYCLRNGVEKVGEKWRSNGRGAMAELRPDEFELRSGRIGGATKLAEMGAPPWGIQREGRWASQAFMRCVRSNMEDALWVCRVLVGRTGEPSRQPRRRTR